MEIVEEFMKSNFTRGPMGTVLGNTTWDETLQKLKDLYSFKDTPPPPTVKVLNLEIDFNNPFVAINGNRIKLTLVELKILTTLVKRMNNVVTREDLAHEVWCGSLSDDNNIDTHMSNLRGKIRSFRGELKTIRRLGFILITV